MQFRAFAVGLLLAFAGGPASAESADFLGAWTADPPDASGIARIVIAPGTGATLDIHVYGRCQPRECDWGVHPARLYSAGPDAKEISSVAVEFATGTSRKHMTLHPSVGHALRVETLTDGADGRSNYATNTAVVFSGDWNEAPRVAQAPGALAASIPAAAEPLPVETPPPPSKPTGESWFDVSGVVGIGPHVPAGYQSAAGEDCTPYNPAEVRVANTDGNWRLGDFSHRLANFGPRREDAARALAVLNHYHFDEQCFVTRDAPAMLYWKRAGLVPKESVAGEACIGVDPSAVKQCTLPAAGA